jgi:hypothetical protein
VLIPELKNTRLSFVGEAYNQYFIITFPFVRNCLESYHFRCKGQEMDSVRGLKTTKAVCLMVCPMPAASIFTHVFKPIRQCHQMPRNDFRESRGREGNLDQRRRHYNVLL